MKIYISLPISGKNVMTQTGIALSVAEQIRDLGHEPVNPFETPLAPPEWSERQKYAYYMGRDIEKLLLCDAVYFFARGGKKVVVAVLNPTLPRLMASNPITT